MRSVPTTLLRWSAAATTIVAAVLVVTALMVAPPPAEAAAVTVDDLTINLVLALGFPLTGTLVIARRPHHPVPWLFVVSGLGAALTVATYLYAHRALIADPGSLPGGVSAAWVSSWVWVTGVWPALTFGLLLFPDGRLPSPRWRPVAWAAGSGLVLAVLSNALRPGPLANHPVVDNPLGVAGLGTVAEAAGVASAPLFLLALGGTCASLVVRYRRATPVERRQLAWLLYAVVVLVAAVFADAVLGRGTVTSVAALAALAFLPVAVAVAIVRHRLFDIDTLINRSLVYGLLTAGIAAIYGLTVAVLGGWFRGDRTLHAVVATAVAAVAFEPARRWLQRVVDRILGGSVDPYRVLSELAERLQGEAHPRAVLAVVAQTVAEALRLSYVAIDVTEGGTRRVAEHGVPIPTSVELDLMHHDRPIGRLVAGGRGDDDPLNPAERRLLEDLARQAGSAVEASRLSYALQRARQDVVVAREEERRRLHRELHDGLGPTLAGLALQLGVASRGSEEQPARTRTLLEGAKREVELLIPTIRQLVDGLRPPALDEVGLIDALRQRGAALASDQLSVEVGASEPLPVLPAATEVAAYRIITEAMTNVARHASARRCRVEVTLNDGLELLITDDGIGLTSGHHVGIGLASMRERAAELGGYCITETAATGGTCVRAHLPLS